MVEVTIQFDIPPGEACQALRLTLLRHFGKLIRELAHNLDAAALPPLAAAVDPTKDGVTDVNPADILVRVPERVALSEYGDEVSLHAVRMEALVVFEKRELRPEAVVALWIDVVHVCGRPLVPCVAVTVVGYRRVLGLVEASLQGVVAMQQLFQGQLERGQCRKQDLLCITAETAALPQTVADCMNN